MTAFRCKQLVRWLAILPGVLLFSLEMLPAQHLSDIDRSTLYPVTRRIPVDWHVLETSHFSVIHPAEYKSDARETGRILESQYDAGQQLVGGSLREYPVLLNPYNDRSNGFVTPLNFRMEVDLHPLQGKALNPRSGNWLETVLPHELVHALQVNHHDFPGLTSLLYLFSPDLARSVHSAVPMGILEGLAVHHESESVVSGGGRGNYALFQGPFQAAFSSGDRWSMGQLVHISDFTRPFNRHYIGGYEFTRWLQERFGEQVSRDAIGFYSRFPFLGYGWALRHATGRWPSGLYDDFVQSTRKRLDSTSSSPSSVRNSDSFKLISLPYEGTEVRRPLWLSEQSIVFHGSFYNARPGFYRYSLVDQKPIRLHETRLVEDYRYDLSPDRDTLLFARYHPHFYYDRQYTSLIHRFAVNNKHKLDIPALYEGFAPAYGPDRTLWSIQNRETTTVLVKQPPATGDKPNATRHYPVDSTKFIAVQPRSGSSDTLAIIANRRGVQGLWLCSPDRITESVSDPPDIALEGGSLFDPRWHPSEDRLMFSSDHTGTMQIYEYDLSAKSLHQLTDHRLNAFEASYRPDGNRIAYVLQGKADKRLALLARDDFLNRPVPRTRWSPGKQTKRKLHRPVIGDSLISASNSWSTHSYNSGFNWLKPRTFLPYLDTETKEVGLQLYSATSLEQQAYRARFTYGRDMFWYDLEYANTRVTPGFEFRASRRPRPASSGNSISFIEHQQFEWAVPLPLRFEQNVRSTTLQVRPSLNYQLLRPFNDRSAPIAGFTRFLTFKLGSQFSYRLQQNIRDLQPNSGIHLVGETRYDFRSWNASRRRGLRLGAFTYLSPLRRFNQSLRVGAEWLTQTGRRLFDTNSLGMPGFRPPLLDQTRHAYQFGSRYTIPLWYPDNGGFLVPLYLSRIYLVAFTRTVGDARDLSLEHSRSIYGSGLRITFRLSNLAIDLGIALSVEPTRDNYYGFLGTF